MKKDLVEIVFILDRSGSMSGLETDTIGGFNNMIEKQKAIEGDAIISTVLFDNHFEVLHNRISLKEIKSMTDKEYFVRGSTALLDAVGRSITKIINIHKNLSEDKKPDQVMFVITTDGMENASTEYSYRKVKELIDQQKSLYDWKFLFLGANIDAADVGSKFGIDKVFTANFHADEQGVKLNYKVLDAAVSSIRKEKKLDKNWKKDIDEDFNRRK